MHDPKFRAANGNRLLSSLFYEEAGEDKSHVLYTLKDYDHNGYPSLYRLYMEEGDIFEYSFANKYFEGWDHWQLVSNAGWFRPYITRWRHELELRIRSEALERLIEDARSGSRTSASSNRFLLEKGWVDKNSKGRPSKEQIKAEAARLAQSREQVEADLLRILETPLHLSKQ
jgi:hypothetical protein